MFFSLLFSYAAYNHSTLCTFHCRKRILKSVSSPKCFLFYKAHFPRHIKFFSFVNDFLMFFQGCRFIASSTDALRRRRSLFFLQTFLFSLSNSQLKVKIDVCLLNLINYSNRFLMRINGKIHDHFFLIHTHRDNNDAIVA